MPGDRLSLATLMVQSNDLFGGFDDLRRSVGDTPVSGDVSAWLGIWDAGTEVNQPPRTGPNQAPRQAGPDPERPNPWPRTP